VTVESVAAVYTRRGFFLANSDRQLGRHDRERHYAQHPGDADRVDVFDRGLVSFVEEHGFGQVVRDADVFAVSDDSPLAFGGNANLTDEPISLISFEERFRKLLRDISGSK
jgi:hypothetical protein